MKILNHIIHTHSQSHLNNRKVNRILVFQSLQIFIYGFHLWRKTQKQLVSPDFSLQLLYVNVVTNCYQIGSCPGKPSLVQKCQHVNIGNAVVSLSSLIILLRSVLVDRGSLVLNHEGASERFIIISCEILSLILFRTFYFCTNIMRGKHCLIEGNSLLVC